MLKKIICKCWCCKEDFLADVRNVGRQKYCPRPACRVAGKAARQRRWLAKPKNRHYFRDAENAGASRVLEEHGSL